MKFHKSYKLSHFEDNFTAVEELIAEARQRFNKTARIYEEAIEYDDGTTLPFKTGNLSAVIQAQRRKGIEANSIKFTVIHLYKEGQERSRIITLEANIKYQTVTLTVASTGNQADIDWGSASYQILTNTANNFFRNSKDKTQKSTVNETTHKRFNFQGSKKLDTRVLIDVGALIVAIVGLIIGYLELVN